MSKKILIQNRFLEGIADYERYIEGIPNLSVDQAAFEHSLDLRTDPSQLTLLPRTSKESGSTVTNLVIDAAHVIGEPFEDTGNLLSNDSFESNTTGWSLDADFTRVSNDSYDGTYSIKQVSTTGYANFTTASGSEIDVEPNTLYKLTWYAKVSAAANQPILQINGGDAYGAGGDPANLLSSTFYFMSDTGGSWVQHSVTVNSQNNTSIGIRIFNNNSAVTAYYDSFRLVRISGDVTYLYDKVGAIYTRDVEGSYEKIRTVSDSHGNGMAFFPEDNYLYYTTDESLGRYGDVLSSTPTFSDDFLRDEGGNASNTHSLSFDGVNDRATKADTASLSQTGDISLEAYIKPSSLPAVGEAMFVMGKWNENSLRSYKMDITAISGVFGDGSDGALTISGNTTQAPIDSGCSGTAASNSLSATNASFAAGQVIFINQTRGTGAGTSQKTKIQSYTAGTITTEDALNYSYNSTGANKAQVIVMPQYTNVTVNNGITWTGKAWNGTVGGFLVYIANGSSTITGSISVTGKGFRGGVTPYGDLAYTGCGEGTGGDLDRQIASPDGNGGGSEYTGSGTKAGGAGGGNGTAGSNGTSAGPSTGGIGGLVAGNASLSSITLGGGGSCGGYDGSGGTRYLGNDGGGAVIIYSASITINNSTGSIVLDGETDAGSGGSNVGGGGGGAGGSCLIRAQTATLNTNRISAQGSAGRTAGGVAGNGGTGGAGRIHLDYLTSYSGTTTPTLDVSQDNSLVTSTTYQLRLSISSTGSNEEHLVKEIDITAGVFARVAVTWDASASTATFYKNGVSLGTDVGALTAIHNNTSEFSVGAHLGTDGSTYEDFFEGLIDDARLFSDIRTPTELSFYKDIELSATEGGLQAYYKFNNASTDLTANSNDLTVSGATYSTTVPFLDSSTRLDIDQSDTTSTGQTYTLATSIDESSDTKRLYFTPAKDPQKSISVNIDTVGTGNWTLTVHDPTNKVVATKTIAVANLTTGFNEFIFDEVWTPVRDVQYHFHLTSTVADGEVVTGTLNNLDTAQFVTYYQFLVTSKHHPIEPTGNFLSVGNKRYVATWNGGVFDPHRLTFPAGHTVISIGTWGGYAVYGTMIGNEVGENQIGYLFFWDMASERYNDFIVLPEGAPCSIFGTQDVLYILAGTKCDLLEYTGGRRARKIKRLPKVLNTDSYTFYRKSMNMHDTLLRIGGASGDSEELERGVYTYGQAREYHPESLTCDYPISTGSRQDSEVEIGLVLPVGEKLLIAWRDGASYGVDIVDPTAAPFATGSYENVIRSDAGIWKEESAYKIKAFFEPLNSGESVTIKYKKDRAETWTEETEDTADATFVELNINDDRWREFQYAVDLETSVSTSPKVREIALEVDDMREERAF